MAEGSRTPRRVFWPTERRSALRIGAWIGGSVAAALSAFSVGPWVVHAPASWRMFFGTLALAVAVPVIVIGIAVGTFVGAAVEEAMLTRRERRAARSAKD